MWVNKDLVLVFSSDVILLIFSLSNPKHCVFLQLGALTKQLSPLFLFHQPPLTSWASI